MNPAALRQHREWGSWDGRLVFVAEVENFLAVSIEDEQLGGRELLAVGPVDEVPAVQS
jgi:hypothetical protein